MEQRWLRAIPVLLFAASLAALATACEGKPVGRKCFLGTVDGGSNTEVVVASPALECQSRTCLQIPLATGVVLPEDSEFASLCTDECSSADECDRVPESPCQNGFACGVATVVGKFCCRKLCMCRDYLVIPDGGLVEPEACNPDNPENTCANLPGRSPAE